MRSLRDRLNAVTSAKPAQKPLNKAERTPFYLREHVVDLQELRGVECTTIEEIKACDPFFEGHTWSADKLLFLDTETTGLGGGAGTVAFEIGLGWIEPRGMVIRQYVMRDYHEEPAMLSEIAGIIRRFDTIVSFNGKSFDLPLLESRMTMNRIRLPVTTWHQIDLLHVARRVYKLRLGRCNLSRLEEVIFGKAREEDLPGSLVPQRYFDYLKTKEFALLEDVLEHNRQDVQSLAELLGHICAVFREPELLIYPQDILGVGKTLLRTGNREKGRACLRIAGCSSLSAQAHMYLADSYRRDRDWNQALSSWQDMIVRGEGSVWPYIESSKYYEHVARDYEKALSYATHALSVVLNDSLLHGDDYKQQESIQKRIRRLQKKAAGKHMK